MVLPWSRRAGTDEAAGEVLARALCLQGHVVALIIAMKPVVTSGKSLPGDIEAERDFDGGRFPYRRSYS
jgi:hypothetical protein